MLLLERLQALRRLGKAHEIDEFGAIAEGIRSLRTLGERDHIIIGIGLGILSAAQQLPEGGDRGREARFLRRRLDGCRAARADVPFFATAFTLHHLSDGFSAALETGNVSSRGARPSTFLVGPEGGC